MLHLCPSQPGGDPTEGDGGPFQIPLGEKFLRNIKSAEGSAAKNMILDCPKKTHFRCANVIPGYVQQHQSGGNKTKRDL